MLAFPQPKGLGTAPALKSGDSLVIANRSAPEVAGCLYLAKRRGYLSGENLQASGGNIGRAFIHSLTR